MKKTINSISELDFYNAFINLPGEIWEELYFTDTLYEISNYGRLKSHWGNKQKILHNKSTMGYKVADLQSNGSRQGYYIHKLVAEHFVNNTKPDKYIKIIHLDNNKLNNKASNLKWVDNSGMFKHAEKFNKRLTTNFRNHATSNAKISRYSADKIRSLLKEGYTGALLAKIFGITEMQVSRIKHNPNWVK